jgi:hypothetical protein
MQTTVTLLPTQVYVLNNTVQVDSTGAPLTTPDPTYGAPTFTSSNPAVASVGPLLPLRVQPTGVVGTTTITGTEVSSDTSKPSIVGTLVVTVPGPLAAGLQINGTAQ